LRCALGGDSLPGRHRALRTARVGVMAAGACHGGPSGRWHGLDASGAALIYYNG